MSPKEYLEVGTLMPFPPPPPPIPERLTCSLPRTWVRQLLSPSLLKLILFMW